jgi:hypothetical protein
MEEELKRCEISVNRELLLTAIYADIDAECGMCPVPDIENAAQSVMNTVEPFLAKHKPVSVEDIAKKLWQRDYPQGGSMHRTYESTSVHDKELYRKEIKFVLTAAGLSYVE